MSEWEPIETAPTDGTRVLTYGPRMANGRPTGNFYVDVCAFWHGRWTTTWMGDRGEPTHWKPHDCLLSKFNEVARERDALRARVEAMRERCARLAEQEIETYHEGLSAVDVRLSFQRGPKWRDGPRIAAAIRALPIEGDGR